jgi:[NiFe] hydrogenase assembly HybE family chaperone
MYANLHPRVTGLIAQLRYVGDAQMRDLPIYNEALEVEAVGFRVRGEALVGVVITPWFINAIYLPLLAVPVEWSKIGSKVEHRLPNGRVVFTRGGDVVTGAFDALSLHSPVTAFASQAEARREAEARLNRLFEPPQTAAKTTDSLESSSRRAFLRGGVRGR